MATEYYTLEEAANVLGLPTDEVNRKAEQGELHAFGEPGSWRFRKDDINTLAIQLDTGTDPDLGAPPAPVQIDDVTPSMADGLDAPIPFDDGFGLDPQPANEPLLPQTDEDLIPITNVLDDPPPAAGFSGINLGDDLPAGQAKSPSKVDTLKPGKPGSDVRLKVDPSNSEFELTVDSSPALEEQLAPVPAPAAARATGGPMIPDSDSDSLFDSELQMEPAPSFDPDPGLAPAPDFDSDPGLAPVADLDADPGLAPAPDLNLDAEMPPAPDLNLDADLAPVPELGPELQPEPQAPRISTLDVEPDPTLGMALGADPAAAPDLGPPAETEGNYGDVQVDFDTSTLDDSMLPLDEPPPPDSDVRLEPAAVSLVPIDPGAPPVESMATEEIDLDAELQQAEQASMERRGKTKPVPGAAPRGTPMPARGTMLPTSSPFELSADDLDAPATSSSSFDRQPMGSEFELTLAPENESSPLNLGDDEDVDLGGLPAKDGLSSSARAELSGINLHNPADSGVSLEKDDASDSVDFELTVDDDMAGPKTIKGKLPDSDSEFELALEEDSSGSMPSVGDLEISSDSGEQKDIFETDLELPAMGGDESHSEAVALDGSDTDLESSDFDLAVSDTDLESHAAAPLEESGSEVVQLPEEEEPSTDAPRKSKVSTGSLDSVDELLLDDDGVEVEDEEDEDELTTGDQTVPAAQAEWGMFPILLLVPCVLVMFMAGLMSYELVHGMWGYHASSKPSGLVVRGVAGLFADDLPKE